MSRVMGSGSNGFAGDEPERAWQKDSFPSFWSEEMLSVNFSIKIWPCFMAFVPVCLALMPMGRKPRSGKVAAAFSAMIRGRKECS
jgi:hypothetical protein